MLFHINKNRRIKIMLTVMKENPKKVVLEKNFTKEELSAYNLYTISGCSQANNDIQEPAFIGCYH